MEKQTVDAEIKMQKAITESGGCWKPCMKPCIKWTAEGMAKGFPKYTMTYWLRESWGICWYPAKAKQSFAN